MRRFTAGVLLVLMMSTGCGKDQAGLIQKVDHVFQDYAGYDRPEKIHSFLKNVEKKRPDQIRVTALTIEGAPIVTEMVFDGDAIAYKRDTRQDGFGVQKLYEKRCRPDFTILDRDEFIEYALENCYGTSGAYDLFYFPKE